MTQLASLVLKDHLDADVTFVPKDIVGGVATTVNTTGVPIGDKTVSFAINRTTTGKRKVTLKLAIPVVQDVVVAGISRPTIVRSAYVDIAFSFDQTSSTVERQDVLALTKSLLGNSGQIVPLVTDLSSPY
jgi:hypothetical protein